MKKNLAAIVLLTTFISINTFAQPGLKWQTDLGGSSAEYLNQICNTKDGGIIMAGYSYSDSSFDKTEHSRGQTDYWIVKLNKAGVKEWDKTFGGSDVDNAFGIQQTTDGGYIIGGYSLSNKSGDKSEDEKGESDFWVIKIDGFGNKQWDKTYGGGRGDGLRALQQTIDGGYILCGSSNSNISFDKSERSRGKDDYWIVKIDALGNKQWDKTFGGSGEDIPFTVEQTRDGGYIVGGYSESDSSGDKSHNSHGKRDYWIVKTDALGNKQWDRTYGGVYYDELRSIQQTKDGGYILGGFSDSPLSHDKTEDSRGFYDYWIIKITSHGKQVWDKTIGGALDDYLYSLQQTKDEGYILAGGSSSNISGEKTEISRGSSDYWLVKLNNQGNILWDKTIGGDWIDEPFSVVEKGKDNFVVGGNSISGISGDKTEAVQAQDYWLVDVKYDSTTAKAVVTNNLIATTNNKDFVVYPVPVKDVLYVESKTSTTISLIDANGKTVLTKNVNGKQALNVATLPAGNYYLKNNTTGEVKNIIIAR